MWAGHGLSLSLRLTQKIALRIFMSVSVENSGDSLFHDRHPTLPVAHTGKLPHHTVQTLPDGLRILLLVDSVVMAPTGCRPLGAASSSCNISAETKDKSRQTGEKGTFKIPMVCTESEQNKVRLEPKPAWRRRPAFSFTRCSGVTELRIHSLLVFENPDGTLNT